MTILASFAVPHPPIILPEVGQGEEEKIRKTIAAYDTVMEKAAGLQPDTLIITSPHGEMYMDYFHIAPGPTRPGGVSASSGRPRWNCPSGMTGIWRP